MALHDVVSALMRRVAAETVMPRFQALAAEEIAEKSPGEVVTIADRESEERLTEGLAALGLGARIVGEEAASRDPSLLDRVGEGLVWLIDPLDGTANFAGGHGPFGMMVALVDDGEPVMGWMLDPQSGRMCHAERGKGASCDGASVRIRGEPRSRTLDRPIAALATQFMTPARRDMVHNAARSHFAQVPIPRCAAESYPRLVFGSNQLALFQRILPWDHAPGVLFLTEAGGHATHWDRSAYRVGGPGAGLLVAASVEHWGAGADLLLEPQGGLIDMETRVA
ncbi:inositol monophosphatase [Altererythrobacter xixiisoli]|uniref:Inositol monophosphatase n=1 Tax=Croceibacterium xixiisoli TaxID=1476466 RepID=A0A6I4TTK4_9SPHN|nr:inositol monophosphatase family protein [Croceibacterium xixiisoli]MXO98550.1 inositol monophosphatase [Croceibacterium xixiisoli]